MAAGSDNNNTSIERLIEIMAALRTPKTGCPWDLEQNFKTIAPYTLEEAYEVLDAIDRGDMADLKDELGDLLFQVVYHARMAEEVEAFNFADVLSCICGKMVRRHPHVFDSHELSTSGEVNELWDAIKAEEKAAKSTGDDAGDIPASILDDVPLALPALSRALKLQKRAAKVGFDWPALGPVFDKLEEEMGELSEAVSVGSHEKIKDELGDVLFSLTNLARHLEIDPEDALRDANYKFLRRFGHIEAGLQKEGRSVDEASLEEMERHWQDAKKLDNTKKSEI